MTVVDDLIVRITADATGFVSGMNAAATKAKGFASGMTPTLGGIGDAFASITKAAAAMSAVVGGAAITALTAAVSKGLEFGDMMAKLSDKTGVSTEALYGWKAAADDVGVELTTITRASLFLQRSIAEAGDTSSAAAKTFHTLGLSLDELRQMSPDKAMGVVADSLNKVTSAGEQTTASMELMGRGAMDLKNFLALGSKGMDEAAQHAQDLGLTLSRFDAAKIEAANDSLDDLKNILLGVSQTLAAEVSPYIVQISADIAAASAESGNFKDAIHSSMQTAVTVLGRLANAWYGVRIEVATVKAYFYDFSEAVNSGLSKVTDAIVYVAKIVEHVGLALWETAKSGQAGFEVLWAALKLGVQKFVYFAEEQFANMLYGAADAMHFLNKEAAKSMEDMALSMSKHAKSGSEAASTEFDKLTTKANDQGAKTKEAWSSVLDIDVSASPISQFFADTKEEASRLAAEAHANLAAILAEPIPSDQFDAWLLKVEAGVQRLRDTKTPVPGDTSEAEVAKEQDPKEAERQLALNIEREKALESLREYLASEIELEQQAYEARKAIIDHALEDKQITADVANEMYTELEARHYADAEAAEQAHQQQLLDIQFQGYQQKTQGLSTALGQLSTLMNSNSRKMFEIGKAAAIANAVVQTAQAAITGYNNGMTAGGPYAGPYLAAAYAAAAIAAGAVQIATISSTSFGGGGSVSAGGGGGVPTVNGQAAPDGGAAGGVSGTSATKQVYINFGGASLFDRTMVQDLMKQISSESADGMPMNVSFQ